MRRTPEAPDIKNAVVAILLRGWGADPPTGVDPGPHGFGAEMLTLFDIGGIERLWSAHEPWLRSKAVEWGWAPEWELRGEKVFFGEYVLRTGRDTKVPFR